MENEFKKLNDKLLKKKSFREEIKKADLAFEIAETIIDARIREGITQKELAKKIKTKQSGIARIESGRHLPNFNSLEKIAKVLNIKIRNPLILEENTPTHYIYFYEAANEDIKTKTKCNISDIFNKIRL